MLRHDHCMFSEENQRSFMGKAFIQPQKVLIVDDEYLIRWALAQSRSEAGYVVTAVEDGWKALESAQKESFDFVVTDLVMPGLDGWQLLERLLQLQTPPRVIVITSQVEENCQRKVRERGGCAYVEKDRLIPGVWEALKAASGE